jgi:membrane associated rhomboid family serine protease
VSIGGRVPWIGSIFASYTCVVMQTMRGRLSRRTRERHHPQRGGASVVLPIGDENLRGRGPAIVTLVIIGINIAVFVLLQLPSDAFTYAWSAVPFEITTGQDLVEPVQVVMNGVTETIPQFPGPDPIQLTLLSSMFMHGGFAHIFGNLLFLWIFGDNVEHTLGRIPYLAFYLLAGLVASFAQIAVNPDSVIPTLGASGAISGVLGAYIVMYPGNRVTVIVYYFATAVPALVAIGLWALLQFVNGFGQIAISEETTGGVAYLAHVGGFVAGVAAGLIACGIGLPARAKAMGMIR